MEVNRGSRGQIFRHRRAQLRACARARAALRQEGYKGSYTLRAKGVVYERAMADYVCAGGWTDELDVAENLVRDGE